MLRRYFAVFAAAILTACASAGSGATHAATRNTNILTREEIGSVPVANAYDAVQRLRPQFFRSHGSTSMSSADAGMPTVYLNRMRYGDISSLKQIDIGSIREIHYYSPAEATNRFSVGSPSGAIEVVTDVH
jgi:hypothetical protein